MFLFGFAEYRGMEERRSKQGGYYYLLKFEDIDTADQVSLYCPADSKFKMDYRKLQRGKVYDIVMNYHLNSYDNSWRIDLYNIENEHKFSNQGQ